MWGCAPRVNCASAPAGWRDAVGWSGTSRAGFLLPMETTSHSAHPSPDSPNPTLAVTPRSLPALLSARISLEQIFTGVCFGRLGRRGREPRDMRWLCRDTAAILLCGRAGQALAWLHCRQWGLAALGFISSMGAGMGASNFKGIKLSESIHWRMIGQRWGRVWRAWSVRSS